LKYEDLDPKTNGTTNYAEIHNGHISKSIPLKGLIPLHE
jgi:hypothetical protein